jgi:glutaminyl-peptide cyclotransferase
MKKINLPEINFFILLSLGIMVYSCNNPGSNDKNGTDTPAPADLNPKILSHSIISAYPHDTSSYTQGLTFYKGELYEGTGLEGKSKLMQKDLATGKSIRQIALDKKYFGEGIAILRDTLYQLTWQNNVVFVYTLKDFKKIKEFPLPTEGWGITHDGNKLIVSTGSGDLYFYDPSTFRLLSKTTIMEGSTVTFNLNELEYIDGYVYANQYNYPYILKIDPAAAKVVAKYDLNDMWNRVKNINPVVDVPNGIAYNELTKKIYVTGKLWPELYEIQLGQ